MEFPQPFHQHYSRLRNDLDRLHPDHDQRDHEKYKDEKSESGDDWLHCRDSCLSTGYTDYTDFSTISAAARIVSSANGGPAICTPIGKPSFDFPAGTVTTGKSKTLKVCAYLNALNVPNVEPRTVTFNVSCG